MIAITGTPGTGKTAVAGVLRRRGYAIESLAELAVRMGASMKGKDEAVIDTAAMSKKLHGRRGRLIVEGHLSHWLGPDLCIVLRCSPKRLRQRLAAREYSKAKVQANVEAEAIDAILVESLENCDDVREIDTTSRKAVNVADCVEEIISDGGEGYLPGSVDWSKEVLAWF
ncbi:MAG: adenylate kinase family protein [Euryarchaeota archaeon]|nr:adenylate kinase family protein [Euryarchaeota archaeon]